MCIIDDFFFLDIFTIGNNVNVMRQKITPSNNISEILAPNKHADLHIRELFDLGGRTNEPAASKCAQLTFMHRAKNNRLNFLCIHDQYP